MPDLRHINDTDLILKGDKDANTHKICKIQILNITREKQTKYLRNSKTNIKYQTQCQAHSELFSKGSHFLFL
jgi:hypothetical protein